MSITIFAIRMITMFRFLLLSVAFFNYGFIDLGLGF